ncbi:RidA family protein [Brachyspira hyodysenteriae]|uniref:Endoribonuclease n=2 Tax=Brachyspira TaxID=29521 RepID=G0EKB9_BRAIP|nr:MULTISPECIES: RidA family protein [Brachyspira]AEM21307.1 endoribonuclease [Brachyspira intermedia PWS/A]ANN64224.1 reactive intermediate/imine deaminase [Brachyspira hyodysenteriae ATCC 27164]KLI18582.1 endoribonuclease L-PSP [Brachyspira hyodysenteriae]KLI20127.1 endoribonuclease L-PSP [Brachyspira hyodysenteriae]KLI26605.1 endoribonuclease L-PSP [Brachyspira hyodysenteriae]
MDKKIIKTHKAPQAIGPYSQAVKSGNFIFASGQIPLDPVSGEMAENDIKKQTERVMENIKGLLESENLTMANIIKTTCFLTDMANFAAFNEVYANYFPENPPARSTVAIKALPKDALVEVEIIAVIS